MEHWYDKACDELDKDLNEGLITYEEYKKEMRNLNADLNEQEGRSCIGYYDESGV